MTEVGNNIFMIFLLYILIVLIMHSIVCAIDTYGSNKFAKAITASWHSTIIHESCFAVNRISAGDATIASEYYKETIQSLLDFSRVQLDSEKADPDQRFHHVVVDRTTIPDLIEVLNEFSIEVSTDLELKDIVFNSREIIMLCFILLDNVLKEKPTTKVKPSNRKPAKGTSQSLDSPRTVPLSEVSNEQHMKAKFDLVSKLQLIDMIFKVCSMNNCCFFHQNTTFHSYFKVYSTTPRA